MYSILSFSYCHCHCVVVVTELLLLQCYHRHCLSLSQCCHCHCIVAVTVLLLLQCYHCHCLSLSQCCHCHCIVTVTVLSHTMTGGSDPSPFTAAQRVPECHRYIHSCSLCEWDIGTAGILRNTPFTTGTEECTAKKVRR